MGEAASRVRRAFVDANVFIRFVTGDDAMKQAAARRLFDQAERGEIRLVSPATTIADCVYVLTSSRLYRLPRAAVAARLLSLLEITEIQIPERDEVIKALELFGTTNLDFGDAMIVAAMEASGDRVVFSYDRDFDRFPGIDRREP